jgi:hypothetical protein
MDNKTLACPSSRPDSPGSAIFAIVDNRGAFPIIRYLPGAVPAKPEVLELADGEKATGVFRFTSPCQNDRCDHFRQGQCSLPEFIQSHTRSSELKPEFCPIRSVCRWFYQHSYDACDRCAALITGDYAVLGDQICGPLDEPLTGTIGSTLLTEKETL